MVLTKNVPKILKNVDVHLDILISITIDKAPAVVRKI